MSEHHEADWTLMTRERREVAALVNSAIDPEEIFTYIDKIDFWDRRLRSGLRSEATWATDAIRSGQYIGWALDEPGAHTDFYRAEDGGLIKIDVTNENGLLCKFKNIDRFDDSHRIAIQENEGWVELTVDDVKASIDYVRWFAGIRDYQVCNKPLKSRSSWEHLEANRDEVENPYIRDFIPRLSDLHPSRSVVEAFREDGQIDVDEYTEIMWRIGVVEEFARDVVLYDEEMSRMAGTGSRGSVSARKGWREENYKVKVKEWVPKLDEDSATRSAKYLYDNRHEGVGLRDVNEERLLVRLKDSTEEVVYLKQVLVFTDGKEIEGDWGPEEDGGSRGVLGTVRRPGMRSSRRS